MPRPRVICCLLALGACDYEAPVNPYAPEPDNAITGVVVAGDVDVTMPTILLLSDAADPMPPLGTGRPVTFGTVPGAAFSAVEGGVRSASFALPGVPDGTWLLTAVMDMDRDFHPAVPTLAGATCGDRAGAHLTALSGGVPAALPLSGGELLSDITVLLGAPIPFERPAFYIAAGEISLSNPLTWAGGLASVGVQAAYGDELELELAGPSDPLVPGPCEVAFWRHFRDADRDGVIDPHPDYPPELGLLDVWPRVYLSWLGEPVDSDDDGTTDAFDRGDEAGTWNTAALAWVPCAPGTTPCIPVDAAVVGQPFPSTSLPVVFSGQAAHTLADGTEQLVADPNAIPRGAWSVTVVLESGQTWTVPNELDTELPFARQLPPPGVTSPRDPTQGTWLRVTD